MKSIKYYLFIFLCILFISCFETPQPHSLEYTETFNMLAQEILSQNEIFEMDDFTRHHKSINGVYLNENPEPADTITVQIPNQSHRPLSQVLDSLNVGRNLFDDLQQKLKETKLRAFYRSSDSILFIVDGFLDNAWGFMYSRNQLNQNGEAFLFGSYTVNLLDSVNRNWWKVSIH